jgi:hypothetical protein
MPGETMSQFTKRLQEDQNAALNALAKQEKLKTNRQLYVTNVILESYILSARTLRLRSERRKRLR